MDLFGSLGGLLLLAIAFLIGSIAERRHVTSLNKREREFLRLPAVTFDAGYNRELVRRTALVTGSVVMSVDHFRRFLAALRSLFGGRLYSYENVVDRARREAILRMKEVLPDAFMIVNMRLEAVTLGRANENRRGSGMVEVIAYGTAIFLSPVH